MEHTHERLRPGMKESEVAAIFEGYVHGKGVGFKGKVEMARAFTLVWSGKGIATFTATGDRPIVANEPTLFEIWVCVDGYWNKQRYPVRLLRRRWHAHRSRVPGPKVPVHWHGHNDFGLGTACAIAAVRAGASWIQGTINGMGERAGNSDLGEIVLALTCLYDVPVAMKLEKIREVSAAVRKAAGYEFEAWKPVVGENLFMRESGAVASQFHMPEAIEPFSADLVGAKRSIVLAKKSGLDSVDLKLKELGMPQLASEQRAQVLASVKRRGIEKRGLVTDEEFRQIVAGCPR